MNIWPYISALVLANGIASLVACMPSHDRQQHAEPVPATLESSSEEIDDSLRRIIASALELSPGERDKILLFEPFTTTSLLIVQRGNQGGVNARLANGRIITEPERFELLRSNGQCWIRHAKTARTFEFTAAACVADAPAEPTDTSLK
ncbi:MAG: hypothetical protein NXH85_03965 [Pseudomonadaceae bacterium]|nr:hypothetical protein [Pseudomonadaceae bacterium]